MAVKYDKLWDILKERNMMKTKLVHDAKISNNAMVKQERTRMSDSKSS